MIGVTDLGVFASENCGRNSNTIAQGLWKNRNLHPYEVGWIIFFLGQTPRETIVLYNSIARLVDTNPTNYYYHPLN
jgi:hypothetical protein